jgi:ABC-type Mn2+/Zn2+ transport system permease subunit
MRKPTTDSLSNLLDEMFATCMHMLRRAARLIGAMPPSALLGVALALALILAILPMAIVLFAAFMLVKLAVLGCVMAKRRHRHRKERLQ